MCFMKHAVRYAVITGLVGGAAALAVGPEGRARVHALLTQTREHVNTAIDAQIGDPVALRAQMKSLEGEYPQRIAAVRQDLAELQQQVAQLKKEQEISDRVVTLANKDLEQIAGLIGRGEEVQQTSGMIGEAKIVRVVFNNESVDLKDAYTKANRIKAVQTAYVNRGTEIARDLAYLGQQEDRLTKLNEQLQTEYTEFQAQLWQMDRQVETISRNDRLIGMMEKRQQTIEEQSRYKADSVGQLSQRFASIRAKQEAKLEALGTSTNTINYEDRAKFELDSQKGLPNFNPSPRTEIVKPSVIEIRPDGTLDSKFDSKLRLAPAPTLTPDASSSKDSAQGPKVVEGKPLASR